MSKICKEFLLLGEGKDEINFFQAFLKHLNFDSSVQIIDYKGKFTFTGKWLENLLKSREPGISLKTLIITMDADKDEQGALNKIKEVLKSNNLPMPKYNKEFERNDDIKVGIYIMPGTGQGMLETLCLDSIAQEPVMQCIDSYMNCIDKFSVKPKGNLDKAKIQVYLASLPEDCRNLGEAAQKSYWNFDNLSFADLKKFLEKIL